MYVQYSWAVPTLVGSYYSCSRKKVKLYRYTAVTQLYLQCVVVVLRAIDSSTSSYYARSSSRQAGGAGGRHG